MKHFYTLCALLCTAINAYGDNSFNPSISLTLDGQYTDISNSELSLPGFPIGGEAHLPSAGFSTNHNELTVSSNIDDKFYGMLNTALIIESGSTAIELEEAFIETLSLNKGLKLKFGQYLSNIGYLNSIHKHAHDFTDRPLVNDALLGGHLIDTGLEVSWIAPTDVYLNIGTSLSTGAQFPGGDNDKNNRGQSLFIKTGNDFSSHSSWQLGASYYHTNFHKRTAGGHHHHEEEGHDELEITNTLSNGNVDIYGVDAVYKWAPNGNTKDVNFKLQGEYFIKKEHGLAEMSEGSATGSAKYKGNQQGFYVQGVLQFKPQWRLGLRQELLVADNTFANYTAEGIDEEEFLEESGLGTEGNPKKSSIMLDYSPSHFSKIRLQYSRFNQGHENADSEDSIALQYVMSIGSHGAHKF
jgi:hypothetical protein